MCRVLTYLGNPLAVEELLYQSDNSFIKQSYQPKHMSLLNLAGFGMAAWQHNSLHPTEPFLYKTAYVPFYDENLRNLSEKITANCLLAHIRGVAYSDKQVVSMQNVHPFIFPGTNIALAHNGLLMQFDEMKYDLLEYIKFPFQKMIRGTTDSEWIYAVFLSQLPDLAMDDTDVIINALLATIRILQTVRKKRNIAVASPLNLFITNGNFIAATRFVFDFGWISAQSPLSAHFTYHSLWYTYGEMYGFYDGQYKMKNSRMQSSIIIASEPLTEDTTTWIEIPEYSLLVVRREENIIRIFSQDIRA